MMSQYRYILSEQSQHVSTIWLNRPEVHNALNGEMLHEIIHCIREFNRSGTTRLILLKGKGRSFCSGADVAWMYQSAMSDYETSDRDSRLLATCFQTISRSGIPVIACVHGAVHAGGVGLMCAGDLVVAHENTSFSIPEVKIGLVPSTLLPYLLTRLNQHKAKMLIYTGQKMKAEDALEIGLVDFVFSEQEADEKTGTLLHELLKASPNALSESKALIGICSAESMPDATIEATIDTLTRVKSSPEAKEGLEAYMHKRDPDWISRL